MNLGEIIDYKHKMETEIAIYIEKKVREFHKETGLLPQVHTFVNKITASRMGEVLDAQILSSVEVEVDFTGCFNLRRKL